MTRATPVSPIVSTLIGTIRAHLHLSSDRYLRPGNDPWRAKTDAPAIGETSAQSAHYSADAPRQTIFAFS